MSLLKQMQLVNIMNDETSAVDVGGNWIDDDECHIAFRFDQDNEDDIEFHLKMSRNSILLLRDFLNVKLLEQKRTLH
jgi:hypothetical protein